MGLGISSGGGGGGGSSLPLAGGTMTGTILVQDNDVDAINSTQERSTGFGFSNGWPTLFQGGTPKCHMPTYGWALSSEGYLGWSDTADARTGTKDARLYRDSADTVAMYRTTNAQSFNLYNTRTDASNYERAALTWDSNVFKIKSEAAGTGTQRSVSLPSYMLLASASDVSPASTTGEQDLSSVTVPAGTLVTNGDKLIVNASAILTSTSMVSLGTFHLDIDGTEVMVSSDAPNQGSAATPDTDTLVLSLEIVRESNTSLRYRGVYHNYNDTAGSYEQVIVVGVEPVTDIDSNSFTVVSRGTPDGATTDVIQKTMDVQVITQ